MNIEIEKIKKGMILGVILGISPVLSLQTILTITLISFINFSILSFVLSSVIFTSIYFLSLDHLMSFGERIHSSYILKPFLTLLFNLPIVPWTQFQSPEVMGSLAIIFILTPIIYFIPLKLNFESKIFYYSKLHSRLGITFALFSSIFLFLNFLLKDKTENDLSRFLGVRAKIENLRHSFLNQEVTLENISFKNKVHEDLISISKINLNYSLKPLFWNRLLIEKGKIGGIKLSSINLNGFKDSEIAKIKKNEIIDLNENLLSLDINHFEELLATEDAIEKIQEINKELNSKSNKRTVLELSNKIQNWKTRKENLTLNQKQPEEKYKNDLLEIKKEIQDNIIQIDEKLNEDLANITNRLSISSADLTDLSPHLHGKNAVDVILMMRKVHEYFGFIIKNNSFFIQKEITKNRKVNFPIWNDVPVLHVKSLTISKDSSKVGYDDISGELNHFSTNPEITKTPITLFVTGNFASKKIRGLIATLTLDYNKNQTTSLSVNMKDFPLENLIFNSSKEMSLGIKKANSKIGILGQVSSDKYRIEFNQSMKSLTLLNKVKNKLIHDLINSEVSKEKNLDISMRAIGNWKSKNLEIHSNLGKKLAQKIFIENKNNFTSLNEKIQDLFKHKIEMNESELINQKNELQGLIQELNSNIESN